MKEDAQPDDKTSIIFALEEKYSIKPNLAQILYEAARGVDTILQIRAVSILKGNYLPEYLKNFSLKKSDLDGEFYYDVIRLIAIYLKKTGEYLVIVFDEYEHVFSWKNKTDRKNLFEDIKLFTDNVKLFGNMFFVFAESDSADNKSESSDDPAFKSRKANLTCNIADISSEEEVQRLFDMILKRYEKYYGISLEDRKKVLFYEICNDSEIKGKTNYRAYTQIIMRILEKCRNSLLQKQKTEIPEEIQLTFNGFERYDTWKNATSISRKTMLCEMSEKIMEISGETIISKSKKRGEYVTDKENMVKKYYITATDNPSGKDLEKRLKSLPKDENEDKRYFIYPEIDDLKETTERDFKIEIVFYNNNTVMYALNIVYENAVKQYDMDSYLEILNTRRNNADD